MTRFAKVEGSQAMLNRLLKYHCVPTDLKVVVECRDGERMGALAPEDGIVYHSQSLLHTNS